MRLDSNRLVIALSATAIGPRINIFFISPSGPRYTKTAQLHECSWAVLYPKGY